jgi:hypothetical protein
MQIIQLVLFGMGEKEAPSERRRLQWLEWVHRRYASTTHQTTTDNSNYARAHNMLLYYSPIKDQRYESINNPAI